jgi:hypothetical protein
MKPEIKKARAEINNLSNLLKEMRQDIDNIKIALAKHYKKKGLPLPPALEQMLKESDLLTDFVNPSEQNSTEPNKK